MNWAKIFLNLTAHYQMRWWPYPCPPAHDWNTYVSDLVFAKITMTEEVMLRSLRMRHGGFIRWSVHFKSIIFYCSELGNLAIFTVRLYEILDCVRKINLFIYSEIVCLFVYLILSFFQSFPSFLFSFLLSFGLFSQMLQRVFWYSHTIFFDLEQGLTTYHNSIVIFDRVVTF